MILLFWASAALIVLAFAGYPLGMLRAAQRRPRSVRKAPGTPRVTAILSVHNAAQRVRTKLDNLLALDYPGECLDIVVACDGCTDGTAQVCRAVGSARIRVLEFPERRGKAACLNDAVQAATGEILFMTDVRQRIEADALRELVANFADPTIGAASGELWFEEVDGGFASSVDAYWRYEKAIRLAESRSGSVVGVTGAIYAMRRTLFEPLPEGTVLDDVLIPMRVIKAGYRVIFEPAAQAWDQVSRSPGAERTRKLRTLAGNFQLVQLAPWLLVPFVNPIWMRFVGHKLLRLLAPWALLALLIATVALARYNLFHFLCLCAAAAAAFVVILAHWLPRLASLLPVRLLVAFVHMNLYSAQAAIVFARNRRLHLW